MLRRWQCPVSWLLLGVTLYETTAKPCVPYRNWNGLYLEESEKRHDEVNSCVDVLLNFGGFMYIGTIIPWKEFQMPDVTGITVGRLFILGFLILFFRRIPAIFAVYKLMPNCVKDWKEALFMSWFGPIGTSESRIVGARY